MKNLTNEGILVIILLTKREIREKQLELARSEKFLADIKTILKNRENGIYHKE